MSPARLRRERARPREAPGRRGATCRRRTARAARERRGAWRRRPRRRTARARRRAGARRSSPHGELELLPEDLRDRGGPARGSRCASPCQRRQVRSRVGSCRSGVGRVAAHARRRARHATASRGGRCRRRTGAPASSCPLDSSSSSSEIRTAGIDDAARTDRAPLARDDARRDLADLVRLVADDDRVAGVRTALVAADEIGVLREQVDDLPLPLVAPLRTDDDGRRHARQSCRSRRPSDTRRGRRKLAPPRRGAVSTAETAGMPDAAHGPSTPARSPTITSAGPPRRRSRPSSGSAAAVAIPPTTNADPTARASPSAPRPS